MRSSRAIWMTLLLTACAAAHARGLGSDGRDRVHARGGEEVGGRRRSRHPYFIGRPSGETFTSLRFVPVRMTPS